MADNLQVEVAGRVVSSVSRTEVDACDCWHRSGAGAGGPCVRCSYRAHGVNSAPRHATARFALTLPLTHHGRDTSRSGQI